MDRQAILEMLSKATVLIISGKPENHRFGTGFIVYSDNLSSYVLSCAHVVAGIEPDPVAVGGNLSHKVTVIARGDSSADDIAVLKIEPALPGRALKLSANNAAMKDLVLSGYQEQEKSYLHRPLKCKLGSRVALVSQTNSERRADAWDLEIVDSYALERGYSGSPVVDQKGNVIAIVSLKENAGMRGIGIAVSALNTAWPDMALPNTDLLFANDNEDAARGEADQLLDSRMDTNTQTAVALFYERFLEVKQTLNILKTYKQLHDALHRIQLHCYDQLLQESKRFPGDQSAIENIQNHANNFSEIVFELKEIESKCFLRREETSWITEKLEPALEMLSQALRGPNERYLRGAIRRIGGVLEYQPVIINHSLYMMADNLKLRALLASLDAVIAKLKTARLDGPSLSQFGNGRNALQELCERLPELITMHNSWQQQENELRLIAGDFAELPARMEELAESWANLKVAIESLCNPSDPLCKALSDHSAQLDAALANNEIPRVKEKFRLYRSQAQGMFFREDRRLKSECEVVPSIVEPLGWAVASLREV